MQVFCDFLNTKRLLPAGNTIKLRFIRNDDDFSIISGTGKFKIQIIPDSLSLSLRKITPSLSVLNRHEKMFQSGKKAIFPFQQAKITTHLVTTGTQSISLSNICTGPLPCQIFAVMIDHDSFSGMLFIFKQYYFRTFNDYFYFHFRKLPEKPLDF